MQEWTVTVVVRTNTAATISKEDVKNAIQELVDDFDGGTAEVATVVEK